MTDLVFVPADEFTRIRALNCSALERTAIFATAARINTLSMIAYAGSGHVGSCFSSLDIVSWLFLNEMRNIEGIAKDEPADLFFSSKGHDAPGLYTVMIGLGLLPHEQLFALRRIDGLPGHPDVSTTNIVANTGSLGMGISKAKGMVRANRLAGYDESIFVMTGDGELQEGQIWESLATAAHDGMGEITVIVDHNKIQSDYLVADTNDLGDLEGKFAAFGWHVRRCNGNDLAAFSSVLDDLRGITGQPKIIIADTIKGRGVSFMEPTPRRDGKPYAFHSGAPAPEAYDKAIAELMIEANRQFQDIGMASLKTENRQRPTMPAAPDGPQRLVDAYSRAIIKEAESNSRLVALDADLILDTGLMPFQQRFPERFFECGIAEQDMVSQAGGMALKGLLPVVHSFACFLTTRPNEQIYNNATERTRIIYVGTLSGLLPGGPGHSHQSVRDISALGSIPGLALIEPSCEAEVAMALGWAARETTGSTYLRLVSIPCAIPYTLPASYEFTEGQGVILFEGDGDAVIIGYGPVLLPEAIAASDIVTQAGGPRPGVVNLPWLNRLDDDWLRDTVAGARQVFTLDNHYVTGGQGEMVAARIAGLGLDAAPSVSHFGLHDIPACGRNDEVLRAHGLDAESLAAEIRHTLAD